MTSRTVPVVSRSGVWFAALLLTLLLSAIPSFAQSGTTNVLTSATASDLQDALDGGGTVILNFNGTITTDNTLFITTNVVLDATSNNITISGGNSARIFEVATNVTFEIRNITLSGGNNTAANGANGNAGNSTGTHSPGGNGGPGGVGKIVRGGAIFNLGTCIATNCLFLTNKVVAGNGGAGGAGGNSLFQGGTGGSGGNGGIAYGGAIYNLFTLVVSNCTFAGNSAFGGNGGLGGTNGSGSLPSYTGAGGAGGGAQGAAIYNAAGANATVQQCSFFGNFARGGASQAATTAPDSGGNGQNGPAGPAGRGGGIYNASFTTVANSTFFDNLAIGGNGGTGGNAATGIQAGIGGNGGNAFGGSIYNENDGQINVTNCTFDGGEVLGGTNGPNGIGSYTNGGGSMGVGYGANIMNSNGVVGSFILANSILANPTNGANSAGSIYDGGYNLSSDKTPKLSNTGSFNSVNAQLGTLQNNGGPTETIAIAATSPAKDQIPADQAPSVDQRGFPRPMPANGYSDIGAFEFGTPLYSVTGNVGTNVSGVVVYAYGSNSTHSVLSDGGNYTFANLPAGTYTIAPFPTNGLSFSPVSQTVTLPPSTSGVNFSSTAAYIAGGVISNQVGTVTVNVFTNSNGNNMLVAQTTTASTGVYLFTNLPPGNYNIIPQSTATSAFQPTSQPLTLPPSNTNENFFEVPATYTVAGQILNVTTPITVVASIGSSGTPFATIQSDSSGNYSFGNLFAGSYVITPQPTNNYTFTPPNASVTVPPSTNSLNFTAATTPTFALSGQITNLHSSINIKAVSTASTNSVSTDGTGKYSFPSLPSSTYSVTPQAVSGITFNPSSLNVVLNSAKSGQNFVAVTTTNSHLGSTHLSGNEFSFTLSGTPDVVYRVQTATNALGPWQTISTNTASANGTISVSNTLQNYPEVFYRAVTP